MSFFRHGRREKRERPRPSAVIINVARDVRERVGREWSRSSKYVRQKQQLSNEAHAIEKTRAPIVIPTLHVRFDYQTKIYFTLWCTKISNPATLCQPRNFSSIRIIHLYDSNQLKITERTERNVIIFFSSIQKNKKCLKPFQKLSQSVWREQKLDEQNVGLRDCIAGECQK